MALQESWQCFVFLFHWENGGREGGGGGAAPSKLNSCKKESYKKSPTTLRCVNKLQGCENSDSIITHGSLPGLTALKTQKHCCAAGWWPQVELCR